MAPFTLPSSIYNGNANGSISNLERVDFEKIDIDLMT